jgi:hypothetical protein
VLTGEAERIESAGATAAGDAPMAVDPPGLAAAEQSADRPTTEELIRILADARKNALDYADSLPNLTCQQTTQRLFAVAGIGDWKLRDAIVEDLTYVNHEESRTVLGQKTAGDLPDNRISSTGEFGGALTNIFKPESKAEFTWKESVTLRGEPAEVFDYRVAKENSAFALVAPGGGAQVGYHGRIYVDRATHGVMSVTNITDEVPKNFPIRKVAVRVDYDYVAINDHDYLLPVSAQLITKVSGSSLSWGSAQAQRYRVQQLPPVRIERCGLWGPGRRKHRSRKGRGNRMGWDDRIPAREVSGEAGSLPHV